MMDRYRKHYMILDIFSHAVGELAIVSNAFGSMRLA